MWKQEWNVNINEIWYDFSIEVLPEEIEQWKEELERESSVRLMKLAPSEKISRNPEETDASRGIFLVTDNGKRCKEAMDAGMPFLLYLHKGNQGESFKEIPYAVMSLEGVDLSYIKAVYKRFLGIPWTILETKRCIIREITEEDLDGLYEIYAEPSISLYTENLYEDREQELAYVRDYIHQVYKFCGYGIWAVIHKESGRLIGRAGLACREGFETPEFGYVIAVPYQRQGYASEVCSAILDYASQKLGFEQIRVLFQKENQASLKLCRKLGFQRERQIEIDGKSMEQYIFRSSESEK